MQTDIRDTGLQQRQQFDAAHQRRGGAVTDEQVERRGQLIETSWDQLDSPGAYVELETGDLYRVPQEAVVQGASPIIQKVSHTTARLVRVSEDPYCPILRARVVAANNNIEPNF